MRKFLNKIFSGEGEKAPGDDIEKFLDGKGIKHPKPETIEYAPDPNEKSFAREPETMELKGFNKFPKRETPNTGKGNKNPGASGSNNQLGSPPVFGLDAESPVAGIAFGPDEGDKNG